MSNIVDVSSGLPYAPSTNTDIKRIFDEKLLEYDRQHQGSKRKPWTQERIYELINEINNGKRSIKAGKKRTSMEYYWMSKYDVIETTNGFDLIFKRKNLTDPIVSVVPRHTYFEILFEIHKSTGHGGRDKMLTNIKAVYYIPKKAVEIFISLCPECTMKKSFPKRTIFTSIPVTQDFNTGGYIDLVNFETCPDGEYTWLLIYQDICTKFVHLRAIKSLRAGDVAAELVTIFSSFGFPSMLQSSYGSEFTTNVREELIAMWPYTTNISNGSHKIDESVQRENKDVENMLRNWMDQNKSTNWSTGINFVQYYKNTLVNNITKTSPYKALFGHEVKTGFRMSNNPITDASTLETEEPSISEQLFTNLTNDSLISGSENIYEIVKIEPNITDTTESLEYLDPDSLSNCKNENSELNDNTDDGSSSSNIIEMEEEERGTKRSAEEALVPNYKKNSLINIGDSIILTIPKIERGPFNTKKISGKIVDIQNGVYRVATNIGMIKNWFSERQLQRRLTNYGDVLDIPISLTEAVASQTSSDDLQKCTCKPALNQCNTMKCNCFRKKIQCGTNCHQSLICVNI